MVVLVIVLAALVAALGVVVANVFVFVLGLGIAGLLLAIVLLKRIEAGATIEAQRYTQQRKQQDALAAMDRLPIDEFTARIADALRLENNQVHVETDSVDCRILHITNRAGTSILAMVKKTDTHVDLATVRHLHELASQQGVKLSYLFTNEDFTPEARQFAQGKPIHLADENALNRFASQAGVTWRQN